MAIGRSVPVLRELQYLLDAGVVAGVTDEQLLERFVAGGEGSEAAFGVLVTRHGPMVRQVGRRVLSNSHDAEDTFQATFLVLALKAGRLRQPDRLSNWLYGVALRIALKPKAGAARRQAHEQRRMAMVPEAVVSEDRSDLLNAQSCGARTANEENDDRSIRSLRDGAQLP